MNRRLRFAVIVYLGLASNPAFAEGGLSRVPARPSPARIIPQFTNRFLSDQGLSALENFPHFRLPSPPETQAYSPQAVIPQSEALTVPPNVLGKLASFPEHLQSGDPSNGTRLANYWEGAVKVTPSDMNGLGVPVVVGASAEFAHGVHSLLSDGRLTKVFRLLSLYGYKVHIDHHVRQHLEDLPSDYDERGGVHSYGPQGNIFVVAEHVREVGGQRWLLNQNWPVSAFHELFHALALTLGRFVATFTPDQKLAYWLGKKGLSEYPSFYSAWQKDIAAMPRGMTDLITPYPYNNGLWYYIGPDGSGYDAAGPPADTAGHHFSLGEVIAQGGPVLMLQEASGMDFDYFLRYFPHTMAEEIRLIETIMGPLFPARSPFRH